MLKRPSGTSITPARKRAQSARANCIQACSSETSDLSLPSIDCEKPRPPPSMGCRLSTSSSLNRSNSTSTTLRRRSPIVASPVITKLRTVTECVNLLRSLALKRVEPYPASLKSLSQEGRDSKGGEGGTVVTGVTGWDGLGGGGTCALVSSSCFLSSFTCSCSTFSFCSISSGDAAQTRLGRGTPNVPTGC